MIVNLPSVWPTRRPPGRKIVEGGQGGVPSPYRRHVEVVELDQADLEDPPRDMLGLGGGLGCGGGRGGLSG
jgi:hypothetical protein